MHGARHSTQSERHLNNNKLNRPIPTRRQRDSPRSGEGYNNRRKEVKHSYLLYTCIIIHCKNVSRAATGYSAMCTHGARRGRGNELVFRWRFARAIDGITETSAGPNG